MLYNIWLGESQTMRGKSEWGEGGVVGLKGGPYSCTMKLFSSFVPLGYL